MSELISTTVLLIRHGMANPIPPNSYKYAVLTDLGRLQCAAVAKALEAAPPKVVYSSPAIRAVQTATIVCEPFGLLHEEDDRLEEFRFGSFDDSSKTIELLESERTDLLIWPYNFRIVPDAETLQEFATRVAAVMEEIILKHPNERVLVAAHAGTLDAIVRWAVGLAPNTNWEYELPFANCSLTEFVYWPNGRVPGKSPRYCEFAKIASTEHLASIVARES